MQTNQRSNSTTAVKNKPETSNTTIWFSVPKGHEANPNIIELRKQLLQDYKEVIEANSSSIDNYTDLGSKNHHILVDKQTENVELLVMSIKLKVTKVSKTKPIINVIFLNTPIANATMHTIYLARMPEDKEIFIEKQLYDFNTFQSRFENETINPQEIDNYLLQIIKYCPETSKEDEYDLVKNRTHYKFGKHKEFKNKCMSLELKFKEELQKRGVVYDNPSLLDDDAREELKQELDNKTDDVPNDLDLYRFLPNELAYQLSEFSRILNIRSAFPFTIFLTTVSSLHKVGTELLVYEPTNYIEVPNIYSMFVAPSGQKKSPVFNSIVEAPLLPIKKKSQEEYKIKHKQYKLERERWKKDKENIFEPVEPHQTEHVVNGTTIEALSQQINKCPNDGIFVAVDEIPSLFESNNKYRGGKGDDKQQWLSLINGKGINNLRVDPTKKVNVDRTLVSVTGGIQPKVLKKYLGNLEDDDGFFARFLYVFQDLTASRLPNRKQKTNLNIVKFLEKYYSSIHNLKKQRYELDDDAYDIFAEKEYQISLKKVRNKHNESLCTILGKVPMYILRIALNLQTINHVGKNSFSNIISAETIQKAIELSDFYLNEILQFHSQIKAEKGELSEQLSNIIKLAKEKNNEVTTREASRIFSNNVKANDILKMFNELQSMNFGEIITKGNSTKFKLVTATADSKARTYSEREMQDILTTDSRTDTPTDTNDSRTNKSTNMDTPVEPNKPTGSTGSNSGSSSGSNQECSQSSQSKDYKSSGSSGSSKEENKNIQAEKDDVYEGLNDAEILIIESIEDNPDILVDELRTILDISSKKLEKVVHKLTKENIFKEYQSIKPIEFTPEFKLKLEETPRKE